MPSAPQTRAAAPDKLSVIVFSGEFERVHYALVLAASAAAVGTPATLFFTMQACDALLKPLPDGSAAWRGMPARGAATAGDADDAFARLGVATFEELLTSCVQLGVSFLVCEMGLRAMELGSASLRDDVPLTVTGAVSFLADASRDGAMLFV